MKSFGQTIDLGKEQSLLGYLSDEQVRDAAAGAVRIAGQEYAKAKSDFARRHEPKRGPTAARVQARYRLLSVRNKRAVAALCILELFKREAVAMTDGELIRAWWGEYRNVLAETTNRVGVLDKLNTMTRELEARGVVQEGRPMPTTGCRELAEECERLKRKRNRV